MRLQKYLAECGIASRRSSQSIIESGRVKVNGKIIFDKSTQITGKDIVELDNKKLNKPEKIYIVLNKPKEYICEHNDKFGRKSIYDIVKINNIRLFSIGRLDYNSCGIIILTNDGDFANKIMHPSSNVIKEYYVESYNKIPDNIIKEFKKGLNIDDIFYKAFDVEKISDYSISIFLHEGKKREIREVFKFFKLNIKLLRRISIGMLKLDKLNIKEGEYKLFSKDFLIKSIGLNE